jgi:peptide/nickel transport system ATP-binding protein
VSVALLEARSLTVSLDRPASQIHVLRNVSFSLAEGRVLGIVGESGAGKSMIGRAVTQLLPHAFRISGGSLEFCGESLVGISETRRRELLGADIAFVPQEPLTALNPALTLGQQFGEHLARLGVPRPKRVELATKLLDTVHLRSPAKLLSQYPHQLSGGMCQRVLIAMAFAGKPKLVIADEPTTALDVIVQARIMRIMLEMTQRQRTAVIFITHDLRLAAHVCDEIMVLYAGVPVEIGPAKQIFNTPRHPYTRCLELTTPSLSAARRELISLPDRMPGLAELGRFSGCRFAPRCPQRQPRCESEDPPLTEFSRGHQSACFFARKVQSSILAPPVIAEPSVTLARNDEPILRIAGLSKRFRREHGLWGASHEEVQAVRGVSFELHPREFLGIVGESGSGKTTIGRLAVGLDKPSDGRIILAGRNVTNVHDKESRNHRVATIQMIFQDPQSALNPRRRVVRIVTQAMEAGNHHAPWSERTARALDLLAEIGMPADAAERYPAQLSGGQRQRVNIARAMCSVPKLLVADEIVSGLDVSVQAQLLNLLLRLKRERHFAVLFISHDLSVVRYLCDRVLVLYRGEVVESGPTEEVFARPRHEYTKALLEAVPPDDLAHPWAALAAAASEARP